MDKYIDVAALIKILVIGLVGGAGIAAVFSLGLVGVSAQLGARERGASVVPGLVAAGVAFAVVIAAAAVGVYVMLRK